MKNKINQIIAGIITNGAVLKNYPKEGVNFLALDSLVNEPALRSIIAEVVREYINPDEINGIAPIASRGYIFSGMIESEYKELGEYLIQKVKRMGDSRYEQLSSTTEYSTETLQIRKGIIKVGDNYLIADDLIATGGSVKTAINLIRKCGGKVNKVFVLTELVDLGARAELKKDGVELISSLKFTNLDLEKILSLQSAYKEAPETPVSFELSNHCLGKQELISLNNNSPKLKVHLASTSPIKEQATRLALPAMFSPLTVQVITHNAESSVNSQPFEQEARLGAINRIAALEESGVNPDGSILIAMENGIRSSKADNKYYDFVHVILKKGDITTSHSQDCCEIPKNIIDAMKKDEQQSYLETWGDTAKRMGIVDDAKNPHQARVFGGISRTAHLYKALCLAVGKLKLELLAPTLDKFVEQSFEVNRMVELNDEHSKVKLSKMGISYSVKPDLINSRPINFYNQGAPVEKWQIPQDKINRNKFKIFQTGDPFSVISKDIEISGANINIHVGIEHDRYSPEVLVQEALQLCRCAYEHGARTITVALPEQFHPLVNYNDFNLQLLELLKASGANNLYFYDDSYTGTLNDFNIEATLPIIIANETNKSRYQIAKRDICSLLNFPQSTAEFNRTFSLDQRIEHFTRRSDYQNVWSQFTNSKDDILKILSSDQLIPSLKISETQFQPHVILSCSSNKPMAKKIAASLRKQGEMVRLYNIEGEGSTAKIPKDVTICGAVVTLVQSTHPDPDNIKASIEYEKNGASPYFFEAVSIARQAQLRGATSINLINPYQFNARSDKAEDNQNGKTAAYVQQNGLLLKAAGINQVITAECHDTHTMSGTYTGTNIRGSAVAALSVIASKLAHEWLESPGASFQGQIRLVTPDAGAAKRTKELTQQLQTILGARISKKRVLGEKQRSSHQDNSAKISSLNAGDVKINPNDKYLITDDETATGSTLCQAIATLRAKGAENISVIVVHNNMPLNWLNRQLCLARFLYMGVNDLHFSDTNEMGTLATSYDDLIKNYSLRSKLTPAEVENHVKAWFEKNIKAKALLGAKETAEQSFERFRSMFKELSLKIQVHDLANEFANKVKTQPYMSNPYAFVHEVDELISRIKNSAAESLAVFDGTSVAAAAVASLKLNLPLYVIPQTEPNLENSRLMLPQAPFALIGSANQSTLINLEASTGYKASSLQPENSQGSTANFVLISKPSKKVASSCNIAKLELKIDDSLTKVEQLYQEIKDKFKNTPVKLLAIGTQGQALAGQLSYLLAKQGINIGFVPVDDSSKHNQNVAVYSGSSHHNYLSVDRNGLKMGETCIAIGANLTGDISQAINNLADNARVHCASYCSVSKAGDCHISKCETQAAERPTPTNVYNSSRNVFFSSVKPTSLADTHLMTDNGSKEEQKSDTCTPN